MRIVNELGQSRTLASGGGQYEVSGAQPKTPPNVPPNALHVTLVLGLGPAPEELSALLGPKNSGSSVYYVECPEFISQMSTAWHQAIPQGWTKISPTKISPTDVRSLSPARVVIYRPAQSLFPSFWGPVLAGLHLSRICPQGPPAKVREVWLPTAPADLLRREISSAFTSLGLSPVELDREQAAPQTMERLRHVRPELFFSLNFHGLDGNGELYHLLRAANIPVAVWCVDNPFHLLSGLKSPFWKDVPLFVTDDWFIPRLRSMGARSVHHLPLAAWEEFAAPPLPATPRHDKVVFVGSSAFPDKNKFFSGLRLPQELTAQASALLEQGRVADADWPDYGWWLNNLPTETLWPGKAARLPGFGAEQSSQAWRAHCVLQAAARLPLRVHGDAGWLDILFGKAELAEPVDYYTELPAVYGQARGVLNMTSLLLPHGLTQRHFDVWMSGGMLLTDATPGLSIFPQELVREVCFSRPQEIPALLERIEAVAGKREEIIRQWQGVLVEGHTYRHRMERVLSCIV